MLYYTLLETESQTMYHKTETTHLHGSFPFPEYLFALLSNQPIIHFLILSR